ECAVGQRDRRIDVAAKGTEYARGNADRARIVGCGVQCTASIVDRRSAMQVRVLRSAETIGMVVAHRGQRQRQAETRIPLNSLLEELERRMDALSFPGIAVGQSAQIELIGSEVGGWTVAQTCDFGRLHRGLDDAGDARRDLVLKVKDV